MIEADLLAQQITRQVAIAQANAEVARRQQELRRRQGEARRRHLQERLHRQALLESVVDQYLASLTGYSDADWEEESYLRNLAAAEESAAQRWLAAQRQCARLLAADQLRQVSGRAAINASVLIISALSAGCPDI